jgi:hypothetical protein
MRITQDEALSLLSKYANERISVLAVFVTPSLSVARVIGPVSVSYVNEVPQLLVGNDDDKSDQIKFKFADCVFEYGDFWEAKRASQDSAAHQYAGFLVVRSEKGDTLSLFEPKK